jgi:hypothetical protein
MKDNVGIAQKQCNTEDTPLKVSKNYVIGDRSLCFFGFLCARAKPVRQRVRKRGRLHVLMSVSQRSGKTAWLGEGCKNENMEGVLEGLAGGRDGERRMRAFCQKGLREGRRA